MHLLLASLTTALAANVLIIDDGDADVATFMTAMDPYGHDLTASSEVGVYEWTFTGAEVDLSTTDVIVWFDGGTAGSYSMPVAGQEALLEFVADGGGVLLFGQNGFQYLAGRHTALGPLIPLRTWTTWTGTGAAVKCTSESHPLCDGYGPEVEVEITGGFSPSYSTAVGSRFAAYRPWWTSEYAAEIGAAWYEHGRGRGVQWGVWGNAGAALYQTPWSDPDLAGLMHNSIQWLAQGPPQADAGGPYVGTAGEDFILDGSGSRARGDGTIVEYRWDIGAIAEVASEEPVVEFDSSVLDGPVSLTVTLEVADAEGRLTEAYATLLAANADPVVEEMDCPTTLNEAEVGSFTAIVSDPEEDDTWTSRWSIGDTPADEGDSISIFFGNDGSFTVSVSVEDDDGGSVEAECPEPVEVLNVPPTIAGDPPTSVDALSLYRFEPAVVDPGVGDDHTWSLAGPAGASVDPETGQINWTPTLDDVGEQTFTLTTNDGDDDGTRTWRVDVQWPDLDSDGSRYDEDCNDDDASIYPGAPELCDSIDSDCDESLADEFDDLDGDETPDCIDPDVDGDGTAAAADCDDFDDTIFPGADEECDFVDSDCDGSLTDVVFVDSDADGLPDCVDTDLDGDGMADAWEEEFELDPEDPDDGSSDTDGDGRSALEEFESGSDPTVYEGPGAPAVYSPEDFSEINELPVVLTIIDGDAPLDQELTHSFSLASTETLEAPFESIEDVAGSFMEYTSATVSSPLTENTWVYWTAHAQDAYTSGAHMPVARFFVNLVNDPPNTPGIYAPLEGSSTDRVELVAIVPDDPDLDDVYVSFSLVLADGSVLLSAEELGTEETVSWSPSIDPEEGAELCWQAHAIDEHGLEGPPTEMTCFTIDLTNLPPSAPELEAPEADGIATSLTPTIRVTNGVDPEDRATEHLFEIDTDPTFSSDNLQTATVESDRTGSTTWTTEEPFEEDSTVYVRVLCTDGTNNSEWTTGQFLVSATNDAPPVPVLLDPADGVPFGEDMMLVTLNSVDPEGSVVVHDFEVRNLRDAVITEVSSVEQGEGATEWSPGALDEGHYQWTARAVDTDGNRSDWASTRSFVVGTPDKVEEPELGGMVTDPKLEGCGCSSPARPARGWVWIVTLLGLALQRRKRPRC